MQERLNFFMTERYTDNTLNTAILQKWGKLDSDESCVANWQRWE